MSVTIKDVAKQANVSPSTVSRVISDSNKISEKTKKRVRKVMEEMGYHINLNARVLVQKSTQTIGIVMKHSASQTLENPFFPELLRGISAECNEKEYSILLTTGNSEEAIFDEVKKLVMGKRVDGIIVIYSKKDDPVVPYLLESGIPFVVIGKPTKEQNRIMYVDNDNVQAGTDATEYLINCGHKRICFIGDDPEYQVVQDRMSGFDIAARKHELKIPDKHYLTFPMKVDEIAEKKISALLETKDRPTAIISSSDVHTLMVITALRKKEIKIPNEMSIITFNNTIISKLSTPPLTSIDIQTYQLGFEAAKIVIELIKNPEMFRKSVIIPAIIVERESVSKL
ncbi:LacI family transcriptional regulator [Oceanobacillus caeni]|uniref:LacI family DNA-binding transcriptional regulator n=1 Tax=Oceanobacillus caeni TaxID=405946 RepID=UPI00214A292D|nr:LacI family DNA-binding transcriptional regulator [Oceanobacillus caeni]MCR1833332.1 LacI family transcriptional regulator [Oceanobacillus caeni]